MTALGFLNFVILQWFGVRLARVIDVLDYDEHGDGNSVAYTRQVGWEWMFWVVPLTGWWSEYRRFGRRR